jgi:ketosteroid isomerase-like protein
MTSDNPMVTVQRMFSAFKARDLDKLLETVHADSRWTYILAVTRVRLNGSMSAGMTSESSSTRFLGI